MNKFNFLVAFWLLISATTLQAQDTAPSKALTPEQEQKIIEHNERVVAPERRTRRDPNVLRQPYLEFRKAKYLLFSAREYWGTSDIKKTIAENLPEDVSLVVMTDSKSQTQKILNRYSKWVPEDRLIVFEADGAGGFWSRDSTPVPIYETTKFEDNSFQRKLELVDANYIHGYEPDLEISEHFELGLQSHDYYFEGGNFVADAEGNCFIVNGRGADRIPDSIFHEMYGCKGLHRFSHDKGIGHVDESVKFLGDKVALTDHEPYKKELEEMGYTVHLLPRPGGSYETYVNSLLVNGTLFLPVFDHKNDQAAIEIYESFGYKVIPLNSSRLSEGKGSIHCITMTYPEEYREFLPIDG